MFGPNGVLLTGAGVLLAAIPLAAQQPPAKPKADKGKALVEFSPKVILAGGSLAYPATGANPYASAAAAPNAYLKGAAAVITPKGGIENPTKNLVAHKAGAAPKTGDNPKVQPGKVGWHKNFAEACAASAQSKKPVLL